MHPFPTNSPAALVWRHFQTLCEIPRPSKGEAALRAHLQTWAKQQGLANEVDTAGNLIIRKPATAGQEHRAGLILQAHLDMVCQANHGTHHDFTRDPIRPVLKNIDGEDWLLAESTTLGADNGIGVALALAALEDITLKHPDLEVLLTVDEEQGMGGALGLEGHRLQGRRLINLDTEDWGQFYIGCAGGIDVNIEQQLPQQRIAADQTTFELHLTGLRGGHSGVDIHEERGNAIKLLWRVLRDLAACYPIAVLGFTGGTARNALPREATVQLALNPKLQAEIESTLNHWQTTLRDELAGVDDRVTLHLQATTEAWSHCLTPAAQSQLIHAMNACPHGVFRTSHAVPGVVETSNNLGMVELNNGQLSANCMVRSFRESGYMALAENIAGLFHLTGANVHFSGGYPGWAPNPQSPLLQDCLRIFEESTGQKPSTQVIHAGLECGILGKKIPGLDMVSFGPDIRGAHAPGEGVRVESVAQCWDFLRLLLGNL